VCDRFDGADGSGISKSTKRASGRKLAFEYAATTVFSSENKRKEKKKANNVDGVLRNERGEPAPSREEVSASTVSKSATAWEREEKEVLETRRVARSVEKGRALKTTWT
jgi:hypothetical protein